MGDGTGDRRRWRPGTRISDGLRAEMLDVARWLTEQGLGHHAEAFAENGIAADILRELTDADLKELGLNLGDRKRLLKAIGALDAGPTQDRVGAVERAASPAAS